jgi:membrane-associated protease RseP (regulator of RpoE activity)
MMSVLYRLSITCAALACATAADVLEHDKASTTTKPDESSAHGKPPAPSHTAFLGVITSKPPSIMTEQLGLKPDEGLVVVSLAPDGPALKSGLAVNDIITVIGDAAIRESRDLTKIIHRHSPGDVVRLKFIRKGEPAELDVTLGSRPAGAVDAREIDKILRKLSEERIAAGENPKNPELLAKRFGPQLAKGGEAMEIPVGASVRIVDEHGCVELKTSGEQKEIIVRDKDSKITWSGPWNNEAEKTAAPPDIARRFKELDIETILESSRIHLTLPGVRKPDKPEPGKARE